jgi:hypothetical protein
VSLAPDGASRVLLASANIAAPAWSPDGRRIAVQVIASDGKRDVGVLDVATGAFEQLAGEGDNATPDVVARRPAPPVQLHADRARGDLVAGRRWEREPGAAGGGGRAEQRGGALAR